MMLMGGLMLLLPLLFVDGLSSVPSSKKRAIFVTGANGYLGREIVFELVKTCHPSNDMIVCLVRASRIADEELFWKKHGSVAVEPYDMLDGGMSLEAAIKKHGSHDCAVLHTASVFGPTEDHTQTALDNVKGVQDLVRCLAQFEHKPRLIHTSSMAAVRGSGQEPRNGEFYTYEDWNDLSELGLNWGNSYQWSKAESEKEAWRLCKELSVSMTSLCPAFIFGPSAALNTTTSYSMTLVKQWMKGESQVQSRLCVDVRDVAKAHVAAAIRNDETLNNQRIIVSTERRLTSQSTARALSQLLSPDEQKAIQYDSKFDGGRIKIGDKEVYATERLKNELGLELRPVEETFVDMGQAMVEQELLQIN